MSLTVIAGLIPTIVFVLIGGVTADRGPRRMIMLSSDVGRAVIVGIVAALSWLQVLQLWHLILLSLLFGLVNSFFLPAYRSIQPQLVEREMLQSANALTQLGRSLSSLLGPTIGAICVAATGPVSAIGLDALSFAISAGCLLVMRMPAIVQPPEGETGNKQAERRGIRGLVEDVREGLRYVMGSAWLLVTIGSVANITYFGPITVAMPLLVHNFYHQGAWLLGVIGTAGAAGTIIGTLVVGQLRRLRRWGLLAYGALIVSCLNLAVLGLPIPQASEPVVATIASAIMGFGLGVYSVIWITILQELVPADKLGRVSSIDMLGSLVLLPMGVGLVGVLTDKFGPSQIFVAGGVLSFLLVSLGLLVKGIRQLE